MHTLKRERNFSLKVIKTRTYKKCDNPNSMKNVNIFISSYTMSKVSTSNRMREDICDAIIVGNQEIYETFLQINKKTNIQQENEKENYEQAIHRRDKTNSL